MNTFVRFGIDYVNNDVGSCHPVYEMYHAFTVTTCDNLLGPINGIWTSIGISLFFLLPAMVVARCLIRQFKKVKNPPYTGEDGDEDNVSFVGIQLNQANKGEAI